MSTYKLTYWNGTALGESLRMLLHYGGQKFEDNRITQEQWPALKPSTPMGMIPMLEIDGVKKHQSIAIARFLGTKYGLAGKDEWENLDIDMIAGTLDDFRIPIFVLFDEKDEKKKAKLINKFKTETVPLFAGRLDEIAKKGNGHLALGRLTWIDFVFTGMLRLFNYGYEDDITTKYPNLKAVVDNVHSLKGVKEYIAIRPETEF